MRRGRLWMKRIYFKLPRFIYVKKYINSTDSINSRVPGYLCGRIMCLYTSRHQFFGNQSLIYHIGICPQVFGINGNIWHPCRDTRIVVFNGPGVSLRSTTGYKY